MSTQTFKRVGFDENSLAGLAAIQGFLKSTGQRGSEADAVRVAIIQTAAWLGTDAATPATDVFGQAIGRVARPRLQIA